MANFYSEDPYDYCEDPLDRGERIEDCEFADPGGNSCLRAETRDNPRDQDCPTCGAENVLTRADVRKGYQCDSCADMAEGLSPQY